MFNWNNPVNNFDPDGRRVAGQPDMFAVWDAMSAMQRSMQASSFSEAMGIPSGSTGWVTTETYTNGSQITFDSFGNPISYSDPNGNSGDRNTYGFTDILKDIVNDVFEFAYSLYVGSDNSNIEGETYKSEYQNPIAPIAPWMDIATSMIEQAEKDPGDNPQIVDFLRSTTINDPYRSRDETHWCSAFVNWVLKKAGYAGTNSAAASSWENYGLQLTNPKYGAIIVLDRGNGKRHVGFYAGSQNGVISVLGGNQGNQVKYSPISNWKGVVGYYWPIQNLP